MLYVISFMVGGLFGVGVMCLFQVNRYESEREYQMELLKEVDSKGESDASV